MSFFKLRKKDFIEGIGSVLSMYCTADYVYPRRGDSNSDIKNLKGDAVKFSRDLRAVTEKKCQEIQIDKV